MLLHKLYINVAIANIFLPAPALYDLRRLNYNQFTEKREKTVIFFPKPKRIWLYCRGSDQSIICYFLFLNHTAFFNEMI